MKHFFLIIVVLCSALLINSTPYHDKWIVVTTIQSPTDDLKKLATLKDWQLVVVADKKTPLDWHLDNCIFLSVETQLTLPYKIIELLPWNHYSRKNIGYLYAIEHGAQIIFETDDDNRLLQDTIPYLPEMSTLKQITSLSSSVNICHHFGCPDVWPRGYPLSAILAADVNELSDVTVRIPLQQGLANNDPDVDALFRLTHKEGTTFNAQQVPVSLKAGSMCPFNSQNTLFYYTAFWGLLIPITPNFRVCDIWRGYWVQRMLWEMNAVLCFLPPLAVQYRNEHNLLKDFADEIPMYLNTERLIQELNTWKASVTATFSDNIENLMNHLIAQDFFKEKELGLLKAWLEDLAALSYTMPL